MTGRPFEEPLVSVVNLVYNTGKFITTTFDSIKGQTYKNLQHIIIDDCSTDDSVAIVEKWIKENNWSCTFIKNTANKGICRNLNYGIKELAKGKYCAIIGDDVMMPDKIAGDVEFLEQHPEYMFCYSKMSNFNVVTGEEIFPLYTGSNDPFHDFVITGNMIMPSPTLFYRTEIFGKVDYYDERYICEDFDMIMKITYKYPVGFRDVYSIRYIVHPGSMTMSKVVRLNNDVLKILKDKWSFLPKYSLYRDKRYLNVFCLLSREYKKDAIKYLPRSLRFFFSKKFMTGMFFLLFSWPKKEKN